MPALGAGGGQGGIGGNPGAIEAAAEQVRGGAAAIGEAGTSVSGRGDAVVARWQGSASGAAHQRIRFLGARTDVGADALSGLPKVLADYAQALREAQARYAAAQLAAGVAATSAASATSAIAAIEAETTAGAVPGNDPGHVGRQRQAATALDAAVEAGQVAAAEMAAAVAAEKTANEVAAGQVQAITAMMAGMAAQAASIPAAVSPNAADWADRPATDNAEQWHFDRVNGGGPAGAQNINVVAQIARVAQRWIGGDEAVKLQQEQDRLREERDAESRREQMAGLRDGSQPFIDAGKELWDDPIGFGKQWVHDKWDLYDALDEDFNGTVADLAKEGVYWDERQAGNGDYADGAMVPGIVAAVVLGKADKHLDGPGPGGRRGAGVPDAAALPRRNLKSGTKGDWNKELNNPKASMTYIVDDKIRFDTDSEKRTVLMRAEKLEIRPSTDDLRNGHSQRTAGRPNRRGLDDPTSDDGGHALPTFLGGPGERINITAMDSGLNQGVAGNRNTYRAFEQDLQELVEGGRRVDLEIKIEYDGKSKRPSGYEATYWVDGVAQEMRTFENEYPKP